MSDNTALTNDQFDAWVEERFEEVRTAALIDLSDSDYTPALDIIADRLMGEARRRRGERRGGGAHLRAVD